MRQTTRNQKLQYCQVTLRGGFLIKLTPCPSNRRKYAVSSSNALQQSRLGTKLQHLQKKSVSVSSWGSWDPLQLLVGFCLLYLPLPDPQARTAAHTDLLDRAQHLLPADLHLPGFESSVQAQKEYCRLKVAVREQSASPLQNISTCFFACAHAAVTMQKSLSTNLALGEQASLQEISSQQVAFAEP